MHQSSDLFALHKLGEITFLVHIEDNDRHISLTAESEGGLVHDLETVLYSLVKCQLFILHGCRVLFRVSCVDTIYACSLEKSIRCTVPPLTEERRKELIKKAKGAGENAKVSVRNARRDAIELLKKAQKEGMPEDLQKEYEQLIQKETDAFSKKVEELVAVKEKEIMTV